MRKPRTTTPTRKTLTDEALAALRRDYEADAEPLTVVAARFSISTDALRRIARDMDDLMVRRAARQADGAAKAAASGMG